MITVIHKPRSCNCGALVVLLLLTTSVLGGDWPQFRGNGTGVSDETNLPVKWGKDQNVRWKADLPGRGLSGPVVAGGKVFVTACSGPDQTRLHMLAFDAATGKQLWQRTVWATGSTICHPKTCMAAPTPATDGRAVYALFATADVLACDVDGNVLWYRSLTGDYPDISNQVGMAASPVLAGDTLVVPMDNVGDSFLAGLDSATGKNRWKVARPKDINWVTPAVRKAGDRTEVVFQGGDAVVAFDAATGKPTWTYPGTGLSTIPSPVVDGNRVLVPGGELVALSPSGPGETPKVEWSSSRLKMGGYPTPLAYRGHVYSVSSNGVLTCGDAKDGTMRWQERARGPVAASPVAADGRIYVVSEKGVTTVVKLGDKPEVEATNDLGDEFLATPAIAGGRIYLRSDKALYCIGAK